MESLINILEEALAELDMISIGFEQSGQWESHSKVQKVVSLVKKAIGERNGIQLSANAGSMLQQPSGTSQTGCGELEASI